MQVYRLLWIPLWLLLTVPLGLAAAPDGQRLYERNCAACHGVDGNGGVGVPLSLPDFQAQVSDEYLATTIRRGRPGRVMPAFSEFGDAEVEALVRHVRTLAPEADPPAETDRPISGNVERGRSLFAQHCASCHGANGEGGQGTGVTFSRRRELPIMAPALNNPGFLAAASDRMIKATLMQGREGTPMDSFLEKGLSEADIDDIVAYVRSFAAEQASREEEPAEPATLVYESPYDLETTITNIERAVTGRNFRLIRNQPLQDGLVPEGEADPGQMIVYFCNFDFLDRALGIDPRVGLFLPCRVTAVEREGKVQVMSINPKRLSTLFNNSELDRLCDEMHQLYASILEEATF